MAYIAVKVIKGHRYGYLVKSVREGSKVRQVVVEYLGRYLDDFGGFVRVVSGEISQKKLSLQTAGSKVRHSPNKRLDIKPSASVMLSLATATPRRSPILPAAELNACQQPSAGTALLTNFSRQSGENHSSGRGLASKTEKSGTL